MHKKQSRIARESNTISAMVSIYCKGNHRSSSLCPECADLLYYAQERLRKCPFGENKPTCLKCPAHCYKPDMREKIGSVMRYAGPRMVLHHPVLALRHMLDGLTSRDNGARRRHS